VVSTVALIAGRPCITRIIWRCGSRRISSASRIESRCTHEHVIERRRETFTERIGG